MAGQGGLARAALVAARHRHDQPRDGLRGSRHRTGFGRADRVGDRERESIRLDELVERRVPLASLAGVACKVTMCLAVGARSRSGKTSTLVERYS